MRKLCYFLLWIIRSRAFQLLLAVVLSLNCTSAALSGSTQRNLQIEAAVGDFAWDFVSWELAALREKLGAMIRRPASELTEAEGAGLVEAYLERAQKIGENEREISRTLSQSNQSPTDEQTASISQLQKEIDALRQQQQAVRVTVEAVIEQQIGWAIAQSGIAWGGQVLPPVKFTFTEPPKKLIVSPRQTIETIYGQMIDAAMPLEKIEELESLLQTEQNLSGYVTGIGGLGAYPTMVLDRASLYWVLSTVAHEWIHNYLTFFPLGINYGLNGEIITLNETTAEIAGNELGRIALLKFYPHRINSEVYPDLYAKDERPPYQAPEFSFRKEMQETRRVVDQLLFFGRIGDAEGYMEARRILFVENGYNLRRLNQAYFAFHGSYGTSAAVSFSDPITPKVFALRKASAGLYEFLKAIRGITTLEALQKVVEGAK